LKFSTINKHFNASCRSPLICLSCQSSVQFRFPEQGRDPQYPQVTLFPLNRYTHGFAPSSLR
jgi:hypothetical protein